MISGAFVEASRSAFACGACTDGGLLQLMPFLPYWAVFFLLWTVIIGNVVAHRARRTCLDLLYPVRLFWGLLGLLVLSVVFLGGSLLLPFIPVALVWISRVVAAAWRHPVPLWCRANRWVAASLVVCIPIGYLLSFSGPTHR